MLIDTMVGLPEYILLSFIIIPMFGIIHKKGSWLRKHGGKLLDAAALIPFGPQAPFLKAGSALLHGGQAVHAAKEGDWLKALGHGVGAGVAGKSAHSGFTGGGAAGLSPWEDQWSGGGNGGGLGSILEIGRAHV